MLIGWPLRSVSPVSLARGASPTYDLNRVPSRNRPGRPIAATRTGAPISANPGSDRASWPGFDLKVVLFAGRSVDGQFGLDGAPQPDLGDDLCG